MVKFWIYDASVLANKNHILEVWPYQYLSMERKFNSISRLIIYLTILGYFFSRQLNILVAGVVTLLVFITLYHVQKNNVKEGMTGLVGEDERNKMNSKDDWNKWKNNMKSLNVQRYNEKNAFDKGATDLKNIMKDKYTLPNRKNPMMNVMMNDYKYNNKRKTAAPSFNKSVEKNINSVAKNPSLSQPLTDSRKLFRDLGDNLNFEHTMRNFHTMPNTKIPNDQRRFAEFCYGNMASCKDGDDISCTKNLRRVGPIGY
tara:strand:- start:121 stop:891 length:771 start_codon:yes stop_codon:yes gene_type:complete